MAVLIVLAVGSLVARVLGFVGVEAMNSWPAATRVGLAVMLFFTASAHFTPMRRDLARMIPPWMPRPEAVVHFSGMFEILGAIGLLLPRTRSIAAVALILFLLAVFPANVHAARAGVTLGRKPATPLWLRAPMQLLFIGLVCWSGLLAAQ